MAVNPAEAREIFGGLRPSNQARDLVRTALDRGLDPQYYVDRAVQQAQESGRVKVHVRPDGPLATLREIISNSGVVFSAKRR